MALSLILTAALTIAGTGESPPFTAGGKEDELDYMPPSHGCDRPAVKPF